MASIRYRLASKVEKKVSIYIVLSIGRGRRYETPTGFYIHSNEWKEDIKGSSKQYGFPKNIGRGDIKNLRADLKELDTFVTNAINSANSDGLVINTNWLKLQINDCFNKKTEQELQEEADALKRNQLTSRINWIIDNADSIVKPNGEIGLSINRVKGYVTFLNTIKEYEKQKKYTVYLKDIDSVFEHEFRHWLLKEKNYSINYAGKNIDNLKAVCRSARVYGLEVNNHVNDIVGFSEDKKSKRVVTLSFEELDTIENLKLDSEKLINARKYILLGCSTGLRYSDLVRLSLINFKKENGLYKIEITQQKTGNEVVIPVLPMAERVIKSGLPYPISDQKLNVYIKEICELAGLTQAEEGSLYDPELKRKVKGTYPKYKLVASHTFRRSFAMNYYKHIPTPVLMEITGHEKESSFLTYLQKPKDKDANAKLMLEYISIMDEKRRVKGVLKCF